MFTFVFIHIHVHIHVRVHVHVHVCVDAHAHACLLCGVCQAARYIWGTGFHWYSGDSFDHVNTTHYNHPEKHLFATEACNCPGVLIDDWGRAEAYAHDIIGDLNSWAEGWTDW